MPCYDGRAPEPTKKQRVGWEAEKILCKQCRDLHAAGQLDTNPELKAWFIKHLAGDVFYGIPANPQVDLDRLLLAELLAGEKFPLKLVIHTTKVSWSTSVLEDYYYIIRHPDGSLVVKDFVPYDEK